MMLVFHFALAVGVMSSNAWDYADFAEATEDCSKPTEEVCNLPEFALRKFNLDCKTAVETLECIIQVEEKCHFDEHFLEFAKQSFDTLKPRCESTGTTEMMDDDYIDCSIPSETTCKLDDFGEMRDLRGRCRDLLKATECVIRVEEKCHFNDLTLEVSKHNLAMLKSVCSSERGETKAGFRDARGTIECIRNVEKTGKCAEPACRFKLLKYAEALLKEGRISEVDANLLTCMGKLNFESCIAVSVERNCGKMAFDELMKALQSMPDDAIIDCRGQRIQDLFPTILQVYKDSERTETLLRNNFKTTRF